jgi:hypothetical protein
MKIMSDTRPDILLPANTPIDIYAALNAQAGFPAVTVGAVISTQNKGNSEIELHSGVDIPTDADGSQVISRLQVATNDNGDLGAWATSIVIDGLVNVRVT